jgi:hypothetical protein
MVLLGPNGVINLNGGTITEGNDGIRNDGRITGNGSMSRFAGGNGDALINSNNQSGNAGLGGTISPGTSVGLISLTNLDFENQNGDLIMEIAGLAPAQYDRIVLDQAGRDASFAAAGTVQVDIIAGLPFVNYNVGDFFDLVVADTVGGVLPTLIMVDSPPYAGVLSFANTGNPAPADMALRLTLTHVPEPASLGLLALSAISILVRNRRT